MPGAIAADEKSPSVPGKPRVFENEFIRDPDIVALEKSPEIALNTHGIHKRVAFRTIDFRNRGRISYISSTIRAMVRFRLLFLVLIINFDV